MSSQEPMADGAAVDVQNVGGIDRTAVTLGSGVNVLTGRNATNRTSFLRALMGALGSDGAALKADADAGRVELTVGDRTAVRTLERRDGTVVAGGDPYLDDAELADLFAFLLESNEARQAVVRGDDLRELLLRPVDTNAIRREIDSVREQRDEVDRQLDELDELERRLPTLESRKRELEETVAETREALQAKRAEIDETDAELSEGGESPVDQKLEELRSVRSDLEDVRFRLESERESREALAEERDRLEDRLAELEATPEGRLDEVETELSRLREEKRSVDSLVNQLQSVVSFNRETLAGDGGVSTLLADDDGDGDDELTDELLADGTVTCWTCGTEVDDERVEGTIERLEEIRQEQLDRRRELAARIDELEETREEYAAVRDERDRAERKLDRTTGELAERRATVEELTAERDRLHDRVGELEARVEELESDAYDELLTLHREANELEFTLDDAETDLGEVEAEIESVESQLAEREELQETRGDLTDRLAELRTRIDRLEREAVEAFNEHMANVLDVLEYGNLARVWIERTEREVREGRRTVTRSSFDLHIVRETAEGTAYEDTVEHLSESEREVVGLVFALAGYLVHDVHEEVPFMVLDSLEAIDADRIARLVEYFEDYPDYLVVALLPEDAAALDEEYRRITDI